MKEKNEFFRKATIIMFGILLVVLFINSTMKDFQNEKMDIKARLGEKVNGGELSISEYIMLCEKTIGIYISAARSGDFMKTYSLLTPEYRDVIDYDKYVESVKDIEFDTAYIEDISILTTKMYKANVIYSGDINQEYLILLKENGYSIIPDKFLIHQKINKKIDKKNVEYELNSYEIYTDNCIFNIIVTNKGKEDVSITEAMMFDERGVEIGVDIDYIIAPGETKKISIPLKAEIFVPTVFGITRETDEKYMYYKFEL